MVPRKKTTEVSCLALLAVVYVCCASVEVDLRCECRPGMYVFQHCTTTQGVLCMNCPEGTYRGDWSKATACIPCPECGKDIVGQEAIRACERDKNNEVHDICQCQAGYYLESPSDTYCRKAQPCQKDHKLLNPDDRKGAPMCVPCETGTHTDGPSFNTTCMPDTDSHNESTSTSKGVPGTTTTAYKDTTADREGNESSSPATTAGAEDGHQGCPFPFVHVLIAVVTTALLCILLTVLIIFMCGSSAEMKKLLKCCHRKPPQLYHLNQNGNVENTGSTQTTAIPMVQRTQEEAIPLLDHYSPQVIITIIPPVKGQGSLYTTSQKDTYAAIRSRLNYIKAAAPTLYTASYVEHVEPICIAIVDTGANLEHPACQTIRDRVTHCENVTNDGDAEDVTDSHGHGTQILSIYAEIFRDCPHIVEFVIIKAVAGGAQFFIGDFQKAVNRLLHQKLERVKIVTVSAGFHMTPREEWNVSDMLNMLKRRKIVIGAASNEGQWRNDRVAYPANNTISIGSVNSNGVKSDFSPEGAEFLTLGEGLKAANPIFTRGETKTWYVTRAGTSFAVPIAAAYVVHFLFQLDYHLRGVPDLNLNECKKTFHTTIGIHSILKQMAKSDVRDPVTGYGPLIPDDKVFLDTHVYRAAVSKVMKPRH